MLGALAALSGAPRAARAEPSLEEKILASKYPHGEYGVYVGWHDPQDWQFDEHGKSAWPIGLKARVKWLDWLRVEGDIAYFRRSESPAVLVSLVDVPQFDALLLGASLQVEPWHEGLLRPYVGAGPLFASLGNDFLAYRPDIHAADPANPDQFEMASWSKFDAGWQLQGGLDFFLGRRFLPFVEYRYQFGSVSLDEEDITSGGLSLHALNLAVEDLHTLPKSSTDDGRPHSRKYDWSGPSVSVGLKVLF